MKETVKDYLKMVFSEFQLITVILLTIMGVLKLIALISGDSVDPFPWSFPLQIIGVSLPTALCCGVFISNHELNKNEFITRVVIHFILCSSIVLCEGYFFQWWGSIGGLITVGVIFLIIYASVWAISNANDKKNSERINNALHNVKTKEDIKE